MRRTALAACLLGLSGCIAPPSSAQRLTEAALDMNVATRFGRMDIAAERVGEKAREAFARHHAAWGRSVRIVDLEFGGFDLVKQDQADVYLDIAWQHPDEATVRFTRVVQRWRDAHGHWELVEEQPKDGDHGLLEDPSATNDAAASGAAPAPAVRRPPRLSYRTRVIEEE